MRPKDITGKLTPGDHHIAIVVARFNEYITEHLLTAALHTWEQLGGHPDNVTIARVPGAFELAVTARKLAEDPNNAAVVCLGCVIKGETDHYDHVVEQTAQGVQQAGTLTGKPCIFGVLTCETLEQAIHRAGAKMGNAGRSAMLTAVEMANLIRTLDAEPKD
ncbi:6,7-dimethyl-8-ribityllumazine synthase [Mucisphaera sp.]|uniref:6,7-dimethyl-8-ribityllumazine synthase n=1 Tax=Mucisphaera sp. TaxID=2913024 RepID=UPI003D10F47A